jgi:hypothetical protein
MSKWSYRLQQVVIVILHLLLLYWIFYALRETGHMKSEYVFYHFVGIGVFGTALIKGCAEWGKWLYRLDKAEQEKRND